MASGLTNTLSELVPSTSTSTSAPSSSMAEPAPSGAVPTYSAHVKAAQTFAKGVSGFIWWIDIVSFPKLSLQKQCRKLYLVYHPNTNVTESPEWKMITSILAQAIGTAHSNN
ncbi:hypothetical protein C8J55DRAFT_558823 [Lentinula edodes]|uniref:Uncharacterized protein n=1 Tax=Lentinula lateritia TaxID=40482 RepID=A0A9W9DVD0_9AGAR|nr:hypothetical protein C8J55DRAFT_558823 [Lentinula edodes]